MISPAGILRAQENNSEKFHLNIKEAIDPIRIDGILDEKSWETADVAKDFYRITPMDTGFAEAKTEVMMTYDQENIYVAVICWDDLPGKNLIASLRRDFNFSANDNFIFFMDTFQDKTNGFSFGASAGGAQWDGLQSDGGTVGLEWDNKWFSKVNREEGRQVHEYMIPFKSIRYKEGIDEWGINFSRLDNKRNEKSSWAPVPRQFPSASLAFVGTLHWDKPPPPPGTNISVIPYVSGRAIKNQEEGSETDYTFDAGFDAKIAVTSSLNLDLTLNPDFSQVEVDRQVTNLSRFELFFPERRQFFLENSDLFANFGDRNIRPFFSRRIGLTNPILTGARLSGKINKDWRIGVLDMITNRVDSVNYPGQNYFVAAFQRRVMERSNIAFMVVNRDGLDVMQGDSLANKWNRVVGADFNLFSANNLWQGKVFLHGSFTPDQQDLSHGLQLEYTGQNLTFEWEHQYVGSDYVAEVGFVPRTGYLRLNPDVGYKWFPKSTVVNRHGPTLRNQFYFTEGWGFTDHILSLNYELLLLNTASYQVGYEESFIQLTEPFDPTNNDKEPLPAGSEHRFRQVEFQMTSDRRNRWTYNAGVKYGGFFNGTLTNLQGSLSYRFQPYGSIAVTADFNRLTFDEEENNSDFLLVGPRLDVTFTDKIFLTTWLQYNNQIDNVNLNARFQWRYAPVSDLFIVYTDNYYSNNFKVKNRAIVIKLNYWLNL
nr:DUF5916 domain-containing protein [Fulvivirga sedimenti]